MDSKVFLYFFKVTKALDSDFTDCLSDSKIGAARDNGKMLSVQSNPVSQCLKCSLLYLNFYCKSFLIYS